MKIFLASLFSSRYPAIGETHALSVIAGALVPRLLPEDELQIYDMVLDGRERYEHLLDLLAGFHPDVIGLSIGYGTFSKISLVLDGLTKIQLNATRIYGGALPHYLYEKILDGVDRDAIIVRGEGDETMPDLIDRLRSDKSYYDLPNLAFNVEGGLVQTARRMADLSALPPPYRLHLSSYPDKAFQVFSEFSRGCSWAGCTFCLRGLLDNEGKRTEYRHFPKERAGADLKMLSLLGFESVTFADEDFFGGGIDDLEATVQALEDYANSADAGLQFDVSATPHSIFALGMSQQEQVIRENLLSRARAAGVRKIFLGIESGSASQLKRYAKGHSKEDALGAIKKCTDLGFDIEVGWILFDPLVTLEELEENLTYLITNGLAKYASYVFNEIRIQKDSRYLRLIKVHQLNTERPLLSDEFDDDTLSYAHSYADDRVATLISQIKSLEDLFRKVHYPLKNLVRFGISGAAGQHAPAARQLLADVRTNMVGNCLSLVRAIKHDPEAGAAFPSSNFELAWRDQVAIFQKKASRIAAAILEAEQNPLAERILAAAD